ncbi:hypothetical protein SKA67_16140 [Enterococcus faecium]
MIFVSKKNARKKRSCNDKKKSSVNNVLARSIMIVVAWKGSDDMPLDDFASKQELQKVKQELAEIKQQNQEVIETLKSLDNGVKQGYIKVRGEDIPK